LDMSFTRPRLLMVVVAGAALAASETRADFTAAVFSGNGLFAPLSQAAGWRFRPTSDVSVTELGVYAGFGGTLSGAATGGLFDVATHTLVASALVPAGNGGTLIDNSRFVAITPVTLTANTPYYLLGDNFTVDVPLLDGGTTYGPGIAYL